MLLLNMQAGQPLRAMAEGGFPGAAAMKRTLFIAFLILIGTARVDAGTCEDNGPNFFIRNGTCWARTITDPDEMSLPERTVCRKKGGTVKIYINKFGLVDITHTTHGKKLQHPRMSMVAGEDETLWETIRDDGLEIRGSLAGEGAASYTESLYRDGKLISKITATNCQPYAGEPGAQRSK